MLAYSVHLNIASDVLASTTSHFSLLFLKMSRLDESTPWHQSKWRRCMQMDPEGSSDCRYVTEIASNNPAILNPPRRQSRHFIRHLLAQTWGDFANHFFGDIPERADLAKFSQNRRFDRQFTRPAQSPEVAKFSCGSAVGNCSGHLHSDFSATKGPFGDAATTTLPENNVRKDHSSGHQRSVRQRR